MTKKHVEEEEVKTSHKVHKEEKPVEKTEVEKLTEVLIYLRDNIVHGNQKHVDMINRALNG